MNSWEFTIQNALVQAARAVAKGRYGVAKVYIKIVGAMLKVVE